MEEQKIIKRQLVKNTILNFLAFTIIYSMLGFIIYTQVSNSLYTSSDQELLNNKNRMAIMQNFEEEKQEREPVIDEKKQRPDKDMQSPNLRLLYIYRNSNGEVLEENGRYEEGYFENITFDKNNLDKIYEVVVDGQYLYRAINYKIEKGGETIYAQVLINVDAENQIITDFSRTLIIAISIAIILSLFASYVLSKKTLKPIIASWKKQTEFVQNASHELRTPLTIIQAKQALLLEEPNSKIIDKAKDITITLNETKRLSKLVKDLMELARADSNKMNLSKERIDIDSIIKSTVDPFNELISSQDKKFIVDLNYKKQINVDRSKIQQLIIILLDNAIKYTEAGEEIKISTFEKDGKLVLEVADTGIGISDEGIKHIFERFYREDKARNRETGGSGLGLSIALSIVDAHGGTIKVDHNKPKGTKFEIKLK